VKPLIVFITLGVLSSALVWAGCGGPGGDVAGCAGSYTGTFTGDKSGPVSAVLNPSGGFAVTFKIDSNEQMAMATVTSTGAIVSPAGFMRVNGTMKLEDCSTTGSWMSLLYGSGTFTLEDL
jgi:hypothetical protein